MILAVTLPTAYANTLTWPGAPPCAAGLQACVSAANPGDTVIVQSSATLDVGAPYLYVTAPIRLVAAPGYRPSLQAGQSISAYYNPGDGVDWSVGIEGFTLLDGAVTVSAQSGNADVTLRGLVVTTVTAVSTVVSGISARNSGSGALHVEISGNLANVAVSTVTQPAGIRVEDSIGGSVSGTIHDNRVSGTSPQGIAGIVVYTSQTSSVQVHSNQVRGNIAYGLLISPFNANVDVQSIVLGNAIRCVGRQGFGLVGPGAYSGTSETQIFNNTIVGCNYGMSVSSGTNLSGRMANNLIVDNNVGISLPAGVDATLGNDHNLVFNNTNNLFTPDPTTITSDPLFQRGDADPRPGAGSPAIDAADSVALRALLSGAGLPEIDADGLRRFKGASSLADIGAFEYGDGALVKFAAADAVIDDPRLDSHSGAVPQLVQDSTPDTYAAPAIEADFMGFNYTSNKFRIVDEAGGAAPTTGSAYNVFVPASGAGAFVHASTVANVLGIASEIDDAYTNGRPDRIVLATHRRVSTAFDHPLGVAYTNNHWYLVQVDGQPGDLFPAGLGFHIYAQDPSLNAFVWTVPSSAGVQPIDHPLLNDEPCGRLYVTSGYSNPAPYRVSYRSGRWTIENTLKLAIPAGATFNIVVDEHAIEFCRYDHIFHDDFD